MRCDVGTGHFARVESGREVVGGDKVKDVIRRIRYTVENADCPAGTETAAPGDDISLGPRRHGLEAYMPIGPYILLVTCCRDMRGE